MDNVILPEKLPEGFSLDMLKKDSKNEYQEKLHGLMKRLRKYGLPEQYTGELFVMSKAKALELGKDVFSLDVSELESVVKDFVENESTLVEPTEDLILDKIIKQSPDIIELGILKIDKHMLYQSIKKSLTRLMCDTYFDVLKEDEEAIIVFGKRYLVL